MLAGSTAERKEWLDMILREWRGRVQHERAGAYPAHFNEHVVPELQAIPGFLGAELLCRDIGDVLEFTVLTRWASMDAVHAFAADDPIRAVVEPDAVAALRDFDARVSHHSVLEQVTGHGT